MTTLEHANLLVNELRREVSAGLDRFHRGRIIEILSALIQDHADACDTILLQIARLSALESEVATERRARDEGHLRESRQADRIHTLEYELATLRASVVSALSSAGPEVAEDERSD